MEVVEISTSGDRIQDVALSQIGGRDFFTKDIEDALLDGRIDLAVHSFKDLATANPPGLTIGAVLERADPRDALVAPAGTDLGSLPPGSVVGTSSLRRKAFLAAARPDVGTRELRGNVPTRLRRFQDGDYDALLLATAGLERLGLADRIAQRLDPGVMTPAPAQGAVAVQIRESDPETRQWVAALDHSPTALATRAERVLLSVLEGGCQVPVGALARMEGRQLHLRARVAELDGSVSLFVETRGPAEDPDALGREAAEALLARGAAEILDRIREATAG